MLEYKIDKMEDGTHTVVFTGKITDDVGVPLSRLALELKDAKKVAFNFKNVRNLDSLGVRRWIMFLREIERDCETFFEDCTVDVINQVNVTPALLGHAYVTSFQTKYFCSTCDVEKEILTQRKDLQPGSYPTAPQCEKCKTVMESEELESIYFKFLNRN